MAPRTVEQGMSHSTLEIAPKTEAASYAYSVPDNYSPPFSTHDPASHAQWDASQPYSPRRRILTRWYFLVLYGLLIALIAGAIGGVIGKSIESNRNNDVANVNTSCPTSNNDNSNTVDLNNHSATPSLSATSSAPTSTGFVRTLSVPKTGCEPATDVQKSFKAFSTFIKAGYTTFCNTGWWSDDLFGISVATPSDCVEACAYYNQFKSSNERPCAGGGFIPAWLDQARAMKEDGGIPYNCFLKANDSSVGRNDRDIEVVALCMDGFCNNVLSPGS